MAIAFDAQSYGTSTTVSHTTSGTNRILIVAVGINTNGQTCSGVTYGGVAMTQVAGIGYQQSTPGNAASFYVFSLVNPPIGTNNIVVSAGGSLTVIGTSYTGAKQSGQPDASGSTSQSLSSSITKSISVSSSGCWQWGGANWVSSVADPTTTTKTGNLSTFRETSGGYKGAVIADSNGTVGTGSQSAGFSFGSNVLEGFVTLSIAPSVAATTNSNFFQFF